MATTRTYIDILVTTGLIGLDHIDEVVHVLFLLGTRQVAVDRISDIAKLRPERRPATHEVDLDLPVGVSGLWAFCLPIQDEMIMNMVSVHHVPALVSSG